VIVGVGQAHGFDVLFSFIAYSMALGEATTFSTLPTFPSGTEFPKNLKYLWNHPNLFRKTNEKIAYHNGAGKRTEIRNTVES
jgi:hypothetical protein